MNEELAIEREKLIGEELDFLFPDTQPSDPDNKYIELAMKEIPYPKAGYVHLRNGGYMRVRLT